MQTGVIGTLWHQDAGDLVDRLDAAFRAGVHKGSGAARCSEQVEGGALACLTLPSNKPSCLPPDPIQVFKTTGLLVAADAWLVNAAQLRTHLGLAQNTCAAQLIGKLYQTEGEAGLDRLSGDYAFVIYDSDAEKIIARRDPFGVRPLFWAMIGPSVAFSSLPETLVDAGLIEGQRDAAGVLDMIARSAADRPATLTKGLNRIPAAMQMTLHRGDKAPVFKRYWTPKPQAENVPQSFEAWTGELRQKMEKAVQSRLPDAGDLAASVSSGLDSTSVVMLAERNLQAGQHIFASTYAASQEAEKAYPGMLDETEVAAQVVAGSNSISWEKIRYGKNAELSNVVIGAAAWMPDADLNPEFRTAKHAALQGADTILTGWGGDNVVSYKGYGVASSLLKTGKWSALRKLLKHEAQSGRSPWKFAAKAVFNAAFSERSRVRQRMKAPFGKASPVVSDLMTGLKHRSGAVSSLSENRTSNTIANRVNAITNPVLALRIEVLACHGLRSGVRYVHPLLDQDLIDFALTCPPEYEFRDGLFRAPVRAAMNGILPDAARLRAQTGYPFVEAILDIASMKQELIDKLAELETDARLHDVFDFDFVRAHLEKLPSFEAAHQHVLDVSSSGKKQAPPLNVSFAAVGAMMTYQAALDEEAAQAHSG